MVDIASFKKLFIQSALEQLESLEKNIKNLEEGNDLNTSLSIVYRCFHSLKSEATIMQQTNMSKVCEFFEKKADSLKTQKRILKPHIEDLKETLAFLKLTLESIKTTDKELPIPTNLLK